MVMYYKPHKLQVESVTLTTDGLGVTRKTSNGWVDVSACRCDKDTALDLTTDAGQTYKSKWHVVAEKADGIKEGDNMRCLDSRGAVIANGVVNILKRSNVFDLMEFWV